MLYPGTLSKVKLKFGSGVCKNVNFSYTQNHSVSPATMARYYDEDNNLLGSKSLEYHFGAPYKKLNFTSASDISYMELWVGNEGGGIDAGIHVDDLEWF